MVPQLKFETRTRLFLTPTEGGEIILLDGGSYALAASENEQNACVYAKVWDRVCTQRSNKAAIGT